MPDTLTTLNDQAFDLNRAYLLKPEGNPFFCHLNYDEWYQQRDFFRTCFCESFHSNLVYVLENRLNNICIDRRILAVKPEYFNDRVLRMFHDNNGINYTNVPVREFLTARQRGESSEIYLKRYLPTLPNDILKEVANIFKEYVIEWERRPPTRGGSFWVIYFSPRNKDIPDITSLPYYGTSTDCPPLEEVLAHIKRQNPKTYFNNSNGEAHQWLKVYYYKSKNKQEFLADISLKLGYTIVETPRNNAKQIFLMPRFMTRALSYENRKVYIQLKDWDKYKKEARWCSHHKDWYHYSAFVKYNVLVNSQVKVFDHARPLPFKLAACPQCNIQWVASFFIPHPQTEEVICPTCIKKNIIYTNRLHTYGRIIEDYHAHRHNQSWKFLIQRTKSQWDKTQLPIGIEIEVQTKLDDRQQERNNTHRDIVSRRSSDMENDIEEAAYNAAWEIYTKQKEFNPDWHNIYFEWDGSLNSGGFEIITNPMTMKFHQEYWPVMLPIMRQYVNGWYVKQRKELPNLDNSTYGIHLTCHTRYWKDIWLVRLARFCAEAENKDFINAMAQRATLYGNNNHLLGGINKPKLNQLFVKEDKTLKTSERSNVYLKRPLVEIRMFRSTLNTESFLKNIEFLTAFWHWCQETAWNTNAINFIKWFSNKEKLYPHLLSYMTRDKFSCKSRQVYPNEFKAFFKPKYLTGQSELFIPEVISPEQELLLEDQGDLL